MYQQMLCSGDDMKLSDTCQETASLRFIWGQLCLGTALHGDSIDQLHMQTASHLCAEDIALVVIKALHQTRVVPVLNGVVGAVMNLHLYGVAPIVDQEDDWVQPKPDHG